MPPFNRVNAKCWSTTVSHEWWYTLDAKSFFACVDALSFPYARSFSAASSKLLRQSWTKRSKLHLPVRFYTESSETDYQSELPDGGAASDVQWHQRHRVMGPIKWLPRQWRLLATKKKLGQALSGMTWLTGGIRPLLGCDAFCWWHLRKNLMLSWSSGGLLMTSSRFMISLAFYEDVIAFLLLWI